MDFNFMEDIDFLRNNVRKFVREQVEPVAMEIEENDRIPKKIVDLSKEMGLFSLGIPAEDGYRRMDWSVRIDRAKCRFKRCELENNSC